MKSEYRVSTRAALCMGVGLLAVATASAQSAAAPAVGRATFGIYCASCHGTSAKGDGVLASILTPKPLI
jgi:mono/diheme cytochrome c family protein